MYILFRWLGSTTNQIKFCTSSFRPNWAPWLGQDFHRSVPTWQIFTSSRWTGRGGVFFGGFLIQMSENTRATGVLISGLTTPCITGRGPTCVVKLYSPSSSVIVPYCCFLAICRFVSCIYDVSTNLETWPHDVYLTNTQPGQAGQLATSSKY